MQHRMANDCTASANGIAVADSPSVRLTLFGSEHSQTGSSIVGETLMTDKLVVEWPLCDGNGVCTFEAPELLEIDDDDNLIVLRDELTDADLPKAQAAVRVCPKHALRIERHG